MSHCAWVVQPIENIADRFAVARLTLRFAADISFIEKAVFTVGIVTLLITNPVAYRLLLCLLLAVGLAVGLAATELSQRLCPEQKLWLVRDNNKVIAYAITLPKEDYTLLSSLYVRHGYRRRRVGTACIQHFIQEIGQPIFVCPASGSKTFYLKLGFVQVIDDERPHTIWGRNRNLLILR